METKKHKSIKLHKKSHSKPSKYLIIPRSTDRLYGYLSNDSPYGFKDQNGAPVVSEPAQTGTTEPQVAVNTHPNLPAKPVSAGIGARKGIETPTLGD